MAPRLSLALASCALAALLAGCASAPQPTFDAHADGAREPARIEPFQAPAADGEAAGLLGVPENPQPKTLLVLSHAWGGRSEDYRADLMAYAERGVLALALEFRGNVADYKVDTGVEDTVAATLALQAKYPSLERTLLYGWSMGGQIALLAPAQAPPGTFDYVFAGSAVTDLEALWNENLPLRPAIEAETGGQPNDVRPEYEERSPVLHASGLAGKGVARVFLVHGAGDGPVPVDHAERMYAALADAGQPVSYYVMTRNTAPWICVPIVSTCVPGPEGGLANHEAGQLHLMAPFIDHRLEGARDPTDAAVRGTYDGQTGQYSPSDVA